MLEVNVKQTHYSFVTVYDTFWIVTRSTFLMIATNQRTGFGSVVTNEEADGDDGDHGSTGPMLGQSWEIFLCCIEQCWQ